MDFQRLAEILWKRKWILLIASLLAAICAFVLTDGSGEKYKASARVATGIVDFGGPSEQNATYVQPFKIETSFGNLIELIKSRSVLEPLGFKIFNYQLGNNKPKGVLDEIAENYSHRDKSKAESYANRWLYKSSEGMDTTGRHLSDEILKDLEIRSKDLSQSISVYRVGQTDFLDVSYTSKDPHLSSYVVNTYCNDFIEFFQKANLAKSNKTVAFFQKLADDKKAELDRKNQELKLIKMSGGVVNIDEQKRSLVNQIQILELEREGAKKNIPAARGAIQRIRNYESAGKDSYGDQLARNRRIVQLRNEINTLNERLIGTGSGDPSLRGRINAKKNEMEALIALGENPEGNTSFEGQDLLNRRLDAELELQYAEANVRSIGQEISRLQNRVNNLVTSDALITELENEIALETEEYKDIASKLSKAIYESKSVKNYLRVIEPARPPDESEPSKRLILAALAGISAFTLLSVLFVLLALMDSTIRTAPEFEHRTGLPVLNSVQYLPFKKLNLEKLYSKRAGRKEERFKQSIRQLRHSIEKDIGQVYLFTSTQPAQGKTFLIVNLSYALSLSNKRVLIIDTNFKHNSLSKMFAESKKTALLNNTRLIGENNLEDHFVAAGSIAEAQNKEVDVISVKPNTLSPAEIFAGKDVMKFIAELTHHYDYIFMEGPDMNNFADSKELADYAERIIAVFSARSSLNSADRESIDFLKSRNGKLLGAVLNMVG